MPKKRHSPEGIVAKLRQVDVMTSQGRTLGEAIRAIGVAEATYHRWRNEYGGLEARPGAPAQGAGVGEQPAQESGLGPDNGLMWKDAPAACGPPKTLYNRWARRSRMGVFARMLMELAQAGQDTETLIIDATHLKAHRTAASLRVKKGAPTTGGGASSAAPRAG